jgi:predicted RNA binding protein YcfA (HicA-like mRNA interferase family)
MTSREIIKKLESAGWRCVWTTGSHPIFSHPTQPERGTVSVPHPRKDMKPGTLANIERSSGVKLR